MNRALTTIDSLLQLAVEGTLAAPPTAPLDGTGYRIDSEATDEWAGKDDMLALRIAGAWQYVAPSNGMRVYDRASRQISLYDLGWSAVIEPTSPSGGSVVDLEARTAIEGLIDAMRNAGIFAG